MPIAPPRQLVLETSSVCQLHCPQCWTGLRWLNRPGHLMQMDLFNKIADEAQAFTKHCYINNWGEPTLNKHLPQMIGRVKQFATIDVSTHGLGLSDVMVDALTQCTTLSVSIDGIDQETYAKYRVGGQLGEALHGLKRLVAEFQGKVNWTFVVFKENEHQLEEAQRMADAIGANIGFKPPVWWDKAKMDTSMPSDEKYRRYRLVDGDWQLKADRFKCREFWETVYVLPNGDLVTCCYDGAAKYVVGNVKEQSLLDVWNGPAYAAMREKHAGGTLNPLCMQHCNLPPN